MEIVAADDDDDDNNYDEEEEDDDALLCRLLAWKHFAAEAHDASLAEILVATQWQLSLLMLMMLSLLGSVCGNCRSLCSECGVLHGKRCN